jgi:hypothetical protein
MLSGMGALFVRYNRNLNPLSISILPYFAKLFSGRFYISRLVSVNEIDLK